MTHATDLDDLPPCAPVRELDFPGGPVSTRGFALREGRTPTTLTAETRDRIAEYAEEAAVRSALNTIMVKLYDLRDAHPHGSWSLRVEAAIRELERARGDAGCGLDWMSRADRRERDGDAIVDAEDAAERMGL